MTTNNASKAADFVAAVRTLNDSLREEVLDGVDRAEIARLNAEIGVALKLADVHATLAVADELRATREHGRHAAHYTGGPGLTLTERMAEARRESGRI